MQLKIFLLFVFFHLALAAQQPYKRVIHNSSPEAKCLDGSPPALYIHQGGDMNNILIFFVGGGFCSGLTTQQVLQDCYKRSKTDLGSSKNLPEQTISPGGYLSTDPQKNKFANWIKVIVTYCDGSQHQGHNNNPISYKDIQLYLRGSDNTKSHFKWLIDTYKIDHAQRVVLTGASAGGIATVMWSNYLRGLLKDPQSLYTIADSAIFANVTFPLTNIYVFSILGSNLFKVSNIDQKSPIQACNAKYPHEQYKCIFTQYSYQFLESRILFINSQYDEVGLQLTSDISCMKDGVSGKTLKYCSQQEMEFIEKYRAQFLNIAKTLVANNHSIWTIACCKHSYACYENFYDVEMQRIPQIVGSSVKNAVQKFVFEGKDTVLIDDGPWPNNSPCAY